MDISRSSYHGRALYVLGLFSLLLIQNGDAFEFKVGGSGDWSVPSVTQSYNHWAEKNRFQIGDSLLFVYPSHKDSVLQVTKEHYTNCKTDKPINKFTNGTTVFKFDQSGPFYFISGHEENCLHNEKLHIVVLADRSGKKSAPPPAPVQSNPSPEPSSDQPQNQTPIENGAPYVNGLGFLGAFVGFTIVLGL